MGWRNLPTLRVGWRKKKDTLRPEKKDTVVCLLGARFWRLRPEKKKIQSSVWRVVLLYCVSFWFWREIGSFFVVAGNFDYNRKKKDTVVCLAGARSLLRPEKKDTIVNIQFVLVQLELKLIQIR